MGDMTGNYWRPSHSSNMLLHFLVLAAGFFTAAIGASKPNIVWIVTDSQDSKLGSLNVQSSVRSLLAEQGMSFSNAFTSSPLSCPSRCSAITGQYVHNHGTSGNTVQGGCDSPSWRTLHEKKTIAAYLTNAGYNTGFFGKYLDQYGLTSTGVDETHIPEGWTFWFALVGDSKYLEYNVSWNGRGFHMGDDYEQDYLTDWLSQQATFFIQDNAKAYKTQGKPLFVYIAPPAAHSPAVPAPQYAEMFLDTTAPRTPSYGVQGVDKHWLVSKGTPQMTEDIVETIDDVYRNRLRTLLSVDDLVTSLMSTLEHEGLLDNTYIIYTSDTGYHLGQFNQQGEARQPYDEDIKVPLIVRGPGVTPNTTSSSLAVNIDIVPTLLELAGGSVPDDIDGMSLRNVLFSTEEEDETGASQQFLIEHYGEGSDTGCLFANGFLHDCHNNTFIGLRSTGPLNTGSLYVQFYSNNSLPVNSSELYFTEYYDLSQDPWELHNTAESLPAAQLDKMQSLLKQWHTCSGVTCRQMRQTYYEYH